MCDTKEIILRVMIECSKGVGIRATDSELLNLGIIIANHRNPLSVQDMTEIVNNSLVQTSRKEAVEIFVLNIKKNYLTLAKFCGMLSDKKPSISDRQHKKGSKNGNIKGIVKCNNCRI